MFMVGEGGRSGNGVSVLFFFLVNLFTADVSSQWSLSFGQKSLI